MQTFWARMSGVVTLSIGWRKSTSWMATQKEASSVSMRWGRNGTRSGESIGIIVPSSCKEQMGIKELRKRLERQGIDGCRVESHKYQL